MSALWNPLYPPETHKYNLKKENIVNVQTYFKLAMLDETGLYLQYFAHLKQHWSEDKYHQRNAPLKSDAHFITRIRKERSDCGHSSFSVIIKILKNAVAFWIKTSYCVLSREIPRNNSMSFARKDLLTL